MRILIVLGGDPPPARLLKKCYREADVILCADGGLAVLWQYNLWPDLLVGDLDSAAAPMVAEYRTQGGRVERHSPNKDQTDGQLAVEWALAARSPQPPNAKGTNTKAQNIEDPNSEAKNAGAQNTTIPKAKDRNIQIPNTQPKSITLLGGFGGRLDHVLGHISLLRLCAEKKVDAVLLDGHQSVRVLRRGVYEFKSAPGRGVSLWPLPACTVKRTEGLLYPLSPLKLKPNHTLGLSNRATASRVLVEIEKGYCCLLTED